MIRLGIGFALGIAAYWVYANREMLGWVVEHRDNLSAASRLKDDISDTLKGIL